MTHTVQAAQLRERVAAIIRAAGSSATEAETVANNLVLANLSGHDSHGVGMVPRYVDAVLEGGLHPNASAAVRLDLDCTPEEAIMVVTDDGEGLPEAFDRQEQDGFGLRVISMIADRLGGTITLGNAARGGAQAEFRLPLDTAGNMA